MLKQKKDIIETLYDDFEISDMISGLFTLITGRFDKDDNLSPDNIEKAYTFCAETFQNMNKTTCKSYIDGIRDKLWDISTLTIGHLQAKEVVGYGEFNLKAYIYYLFKNERLSELTTIPFTKVVELAMDCTESPELYNMYHVYKKLINDIFNKSLFKGCPPLNNILTIEESMEDVLKSLLISHNTINNVYISNKNRLIESKMKECVMKRLSDEDTVFDKEVVRKLITDYEFISKITLNEEQVNGICMALSKSLSFISGSAGTGKSTLFECFTFVYEKLYPKCKIIYTAISGKAVMVLKNYIGVNKNRTYMTITKLSRNAVSSNVIICDEASMIGYPHMLMLLDKCNKVVMVGDVKQALPIKSVGQAFISLIHKDYCANNVVTLKHIHRQKKGSDVLTVIDKYNSRNREPFSLEPYTNQTEGVYFKEINTDDELSAFYLEFNKKFPSMIGIQSQKVDDINKHIQSVLNKKKRKHKIYNHDFYIGDKVMRVQNFSIEKHDIFIPNGASGHISNIVGQFYYIEYDDPTYKTEEIPKENFINEFKLNYIQTIHKNQGSSAEQVLLHIPTNSQYTYNLMDYRIPGRKNLLYTGLSRAKSLLVIVGDSLHVLNVNKNTDYFVPIDNLDTSS